MTDPVDRWAAWDDDPPDPPAGPAGQPHFDGLPAFVAWLASTYRRDIDDGRHRTWCPSWWAHAEAIEVLEGLWRAWEQLRLPAHAAFGRATWWKDYAYPLLYELTAEDGPFQRCSITAGHSPDPLPPLRLEDPPPGMFTAGDVG